MAETIIIDVKTNYTDNMSPAIEAAGRAMDKLEQSFRRMDKMMGSMRGNKAFDSLTGNGKFMASFDVKDNASKQMDSILAGVKRLSGISTIRFAVDIIDHVTQPLQNIMSMAMNAGENLGRMIMQKGWTRVTELDAAKAKLSGLGNTAADIQEISKNASDAVTGTAYSLNEAVTAAASAVAAGMKPGEQLKQYLTDIADVAGISGRSMGEIGSIMNSVVTTGKAQNDTLQRFAERGLPIYQWLAKTLNTTEDQISSMAKAGEIGIESLQAAIQTNIAGAAQEMGDKTILGVMANINAAYAKLGEAIIGASDDQGSLAGQAHEFLLEYKTDVNKLKTPLTELGRSMADVVAQFRPQAIELMNKGFDLMKDRLEALNTVIKSPEFQNADLFGKMKIAWDEVIGDPFSEWWESTGGPAVSDFWESKVQPMIVKGAESLGDGLGTGLSAILKGIFSWNQGGEAGEVVEGAASVGLGFANGFLKGFDGSGVAAAIANSIKTAISDVLSSLFTGKLTGSSFLNTLFLGYGAMKLAPLFRGAFGLGKGAAGLGGLLFGGGGAGALATGAQGAATAGGLGLFGRLGMGIATHGNTAAASAAGIVAPALGHTLLGLGSVAGGVMGGVSAISGIKDLVTSVKETDEEAKKANLGSGLSKLGGVGAGAAIGGLIGNVPGALIGAGIGGLIGLFTGNSIKRNVQEADKGLANLTKGTKAYTQATDRATQRMSTLTYSAEDVSTAIKSIYGEENVFARGNASIQTSQSRMEQISSSISSLQGMQEQVQAGVNLSDSEADKYVSTLKSVMDDTMESVIEYSTGEFLNLQSVITNSEGEAKGVLTKARTDLTSNTNKVRESIMKDQEALNGLIESYDKDEMSFDDFVSQTVGYVDHMTQAAQEYTNVGATQQKLIRSLEQSGGYSPEELAKVAADFNSIDQETAEQNKGALRQLIATYGRLYGAGSSEQTAAIDASTASILKDQAEKRSESLGFLIDSMTDGFTEEADAYMDTKDFIGTLMSKSDRGQFSENQIGNDIGIRTNTMGEDLSAEMLGAIIGNRIGFGDDSGSDEISALMTNANQYGEAIRGFVESLESDMTELHQNGLAIPENMMNNYEEAIKLLALGGDESAKTQHAANELAKAAMDESSKYHSEAIDIINSILDENKHYFSEDSEETDKLFAEALKNTRYDTETGSEGYGKMSGSPHGLMTFEKTGEATGKAAEKLVEAGDCWWGIARDFLGKEPTMEDIEKLQALNPEIAERGLQPGDVVKLSEGVENIAKVGDELVSENVYKGGGETEGYVYGRGVGKGNKSGEVTVQESSRKGAEAILSEWKGKGQSQGNKGSNFFSDVANSYVDWVTKHAGTTEKQIATADKGGGGELDWSHTYDWRESRINEATGSSGRVSGSAVGGYNHKEETRLSPTQEVVTQGILSWADKFVPVFDSIDTVSSILSTAAGSYENWVKEHAGDTEEQLERANRGGGGELDWFQTFDWNGGAGEGSSASSGAGTPDLSGLGQQIMEQWQSDISGLSFDGSSLSGQVSSGVGGAISTGGEAGAQEGAAATQSAVNSSLSGITAPAVTISAPVTVDPIVKVNSKSVSVGATSGGTGSTTVTVGSLGAHEAGGFAAGGLVGSAELSWLAEEGYPEMVIPFAPHRRSRALELLAQAEDALGVTKHANGGIIGGMLPNGSDGERGSDSVSSSGKGTVNVGGISFSINANGGGDIVTQIQGRSAEITEIVTNALADALEQAYENTPLAAG